VIPMLSDIVYLVLTAGLFGLTWGFARICARV
jgi:hypothetical protein